MAFKTIVPSEFPKPPTGTYVASVQAIWDLGTKTGKFGNDERQFVLNFELDALTTEGQPYTIIQFINPIICNTRAGKSRFWSILEELFGRTLTKTEAAELCPEPKTLLGRPCVLKVQYDADRGRSAIMGIAPLLKGQRAPVPVSGLEYLELSKEEFDDRIFSSLSKYFQTIIT